MSHITKKRYESTQIQIVNFLSEFIRLCQEKFIADLIKRQIWALSDFLILVVDFDMLTSAEEKSPWEK